VHNAADNMMGRFLSPDPSALDYADPTNPQSLNLYSYVLNNWSTGERADCLKLPNPASGHES